MNIEFVVHTLRQPLAELKFSNSGPWRFVKVISQPDYSLGYYLWSPLPKRPEVQIEVGVGTESGIYQRPIEDIADIDTRNYRSMKGHKKERYLEAFVADLAHVTHSRAGVVLPTSFTERLKREGVVYFDEMLFSVVRDTTEQLERAWKESFGLELIRATRGKPVYRTGIGSSVHEPQVLNHMTRLAYALVQRYGGAINFRDRWFTELPDLNHVRASTPLEKEGAGS